MTMDPLGYGATSYWLETSGDDLTPRPPLDGSADADVAILGAGYTGLWTAYELLKRSPNLKVTILEREIAGFGASGRNAGALSPDLPISWASLEHRFGRPSMIACETAMADSVDEVGRVSIEEGIEADYVKADRLMIARSPSQVPAMDAHWKALEAAGLAAGYVRLDTARTAEHVRVEGACGSIVGKHYASVHPGRLVRGLARAVERRGGVIHEQTSVTAVTPGNANGRVRPVLRTPHGDLRATTVVLAGEAYLSQLRQWHRQLIPTYSLIVLTEPLTESQWAEIGWRNRECLVSYRLSVEYLMRTPDGRVLFGGRGAPYRFGSRIKPEYDRDERTQTMLRRLVGAWFPSLRGIRFTHAWGGPLGVPRDWMPTFSHDPRTGLASARGYTGNGLSLANLAGRVLAELITGARTEIATLPLVNHRSPNWEPEPLRWLGARFVSESFLRLDRKAERTGVAPTGRSLAERLAAR